MGICMSEYMHNLNLSALPKSSDTEDIDRTQYI